MKKIEEGDFCPECRIGYLLVRKGDNCSCHINPPCPECEQVILICNFCEMEFEICC